MNRLTLSLFILILAINPAIAAQNIGAISHYEGWAYRMVDGEKVRLAPHDSVYLNDVIVTGNESALGITFNDQSALHVGKNSQITLDHFVYDPNKNMVESAIGISKGFFRYVGSGVKKKTVSLNTPVSTIGIRGTRFFGKVDDTGKTMIALEECCVEMRSDAGAVMLETPQTYSEISSRDAVPTTPVACDIQWVSDVSRALGISTQDLGYMQ